VKEENVSDPKNDLVETFANGFPLSSDCEEDYPTAHSAT
jgi:hypothetical protein